MTGFRVALKNIRLKEDPDGKVHIARVKKLAPGRSVSREIVKAAKLEAKWKEKGK